MNGIPPSRTGTYNNIFGRPPGPKPSWFAFWLSILAGGPLRTRPRPPLRYARTLHSAALMPAQIFIARRQTEQAATRTPPEKGSVMTDTVQITETTATGPDQPVGTLEHLDPHSLMLELNVRDAADLDAQFVASIKEHGVLIPIAAVRSDDGTVWVRAGQRRALAAREANLSSVPVYVRPATAIDEAGQAVERLSEQIVENDQRRQLTEAQRARGIQQMIDAGLSVTKVAKIHRTNAPRPPLA